MIRALSIALALLALAPSLPAQAQLSRSERKERIKNLPAVYRQFLLDVGPIIQPAEEDAFLNLESDAQRDIFIDAFWTRHAPSGAAGETFRAKYYELIAEAAEKYRKHTDRYTVYVVNGEPAEILDPDCHDYVQPMQVWHYNRLANGSSADVLFYIPQHGIDYVLWQPGGRNLNEALEEMLTIPVGQEQGVTKVFFVHMVRRQLVQPDGVNGRDLQIARDHIA